MIIDFIQPVYSNEDIRNLHKEIRVARNKPKGIKGPTGLYIDIFEFEENLIGTYNSLNAVGRERG
jgi:hypothetical protein